MTGFARSRWSTSAEAVSWNRVKSTVELTEICILTKRSTIIEGLYRIRTAFKISTMKETGFY